MKHCSFCNHGLGFCGLPFFRENFKGLKGFSKADAIYLFIFLLPSKRYYRLSRRFLQQVGIIYNTVLFVK